MIDEKILSIHTAYLAKIISTNGSTAKIQPLGKVKAYGGKAQAQKPLTDVPIIHSARNKVTNKYISSVDENLAVLTPLSAGDIVIVVCCERNITDAKKGINSTPVIGHHSKSDSVIVGIL